ncbi:hypothetical protein NJC40_11870 [Pseudomonas sp. 21LCFQ02]|uniref:hypothetical protein n=1 Tax=unclassified Pseudomonas TaxID=196821 RepID=UPI0020985AE7|nr:MULTISPECIES: hypothetical protein [unclassified Pseudomonas]MCO8163122.1 hypothetical protein [Pseudomonas sp. 21LCFQ010]MCO8168468.1 hypothetical protein [Pseudomonas sp. 21LCFQ02]MCQ9424155.1 hypothetical protein [Pseudomonas sp. LJDD11]
MPWYLLTFKNFTAAHNKKLAYTVTTVGALRAAVRAAMIALELPRDTHNNLEP